MFDTKFVNVGKKRDCAKHGLVYFAKHFDRQMTMDFFIFYDFRALVATL